MSASSARRCLSERLLLNFSSRRTQDPMFQQTDETLSPLSWLYSPESLRMGPSVPTSSIPDLGHKEVVSEPDEHIVTTPKKSTAKPPFSYSTLICMALEEAKDNRLTLADIYAWITNNFEYYRMASTTWQNAIRHNLSLSKLFEKVARQPGEPGKGSFWRLNSEHSDSMFKKRRLFYGQDSVTVNPAAKRVKREDRTSSIKVEPCEDAAAVLNLQMDDLPSALTGDDFNWNVQPEKTSAANPDINLDQYEAAMAASSITSLSPPPSDEDSDASLGHLFSRDLVNPVDLTVKGQSLATQAWWGDNSSFSTSMPVFPDQQPEINVQLASNKSDFEQAITHFDFDFQTLMEEDTLLSAHSHRSLSAPIYAA